MPASTLRFGPFELDPIRRVLTRDDAPVSLRPMAIALLCYLAERRDRVVSKDELLAALWPDGSGTEANLTVTIAAVRKSLDDTDGQHRMLITVPREGYRFVAEVAAGEPEPGGMPARIALLPIEVRGESIPEDSDLNERICEAISRHVQCLAGYRIECPKLAELDGESLTEIEDRLGAEAVLAGMLEGNGESTRLELRLVDREGADVWHTQIAHPTNELRTLPLRAARAVVLALNPRPGQRPPRLASDPPEASAALEEARLHFASGEGLPALHRASVAFQQAVDLAPELAPAHAGLGETLLILRTAALVDPVAAAERIRHAATEAFRHDPLLEDTHMLLAQVCMILEHDWCAAREHLLSALEFAPDRAWTHARYAIYLAWRRQFEAALDSIRRAHDLDPLSMRLTAETAKIHHFAGQTGVALSILESATSRRLEFGTGWMLMTWFHIGNGDPDAALRCLEPVRRQLEATAIWDVFTGTAHGVAGRAELARAALESLRARARRGGTIPPQFEATILLSLGDFAAATELVRRSGEDGYGEFPMVEADPFWAPLRAWPGYAPIRQKFFGKRLTDD